MTIGRRRHRYRYGRPPAPHWWPEGEVWPPPDPLRRWRRDRSRFVGRFAFIFGIIWLLTTVGGVTLTGRGGPAVLLVVVSLFAMFFVLVVRRVGGPLGDLVTAARRVAGGDLTARVRPDGPPPVRAVANAFNDMAERLAAQEKQRRELMADIAHELRTPLSVVQGRLEGLIDGVYPSDPSQLEPLLDETRVLARIVDDLRTLANAESGVLTLEKEPTDIDMLLRDSAAAVRDEALRHGIAITIADEPPAASINIDPVRMRQVIVNLLVNAVRHGGSGSSVSADARVDGGTLTIRVSDTGPGIPPDELPHIFDRFYKRRGSSGSGLGLTIARTLARAHGGEITAESRVGKGTTMTVTLPIASSEV